MVVAMGERSGLGGRIAARARRFGPLPWSVFMEAALYDAEDGFYQAGGRAGRGGDFVTSPELGPLFAAVWAQALDQCWEELGRPDPFFAVEAAAGAGTLARDILAARPACAPALRYVLVERSAVLRAAQMQRLPIEHPAFVLGPLAAGADPDEEAQTAPGAGPLVTALAELPAGPVTGVVLANELLDNLAFDLLEWRGGRWHEVLVAAAPSSTVEAGGPPSARSHEPTEPAEATAGAEGGEDVVAAGPGAGVGAAGGEGVVAAGPGAGVGAAGGEGVVAAGPGAGVGAAGGEGVVAAGPGAGVGAAGGEGVVAAGPGAGVGATGGEVVLPARVGAGVGELVELLVPAPPDVVAEANRLVADRASLPEGARIPLQREAAAWLRQALAVVEAGRVIVIDYADTTDALARRDWTDWLRTFRQHAAALSPLQSPGSQDITCVVASDQLAGVRSLDDDRSQSEWLAEHGLSGLVEAAREMWRSRAGIGDLAALAARSRVNEADALSDPGGLGGHRVLQWVVDRHA